jgi:hypothetical protein
MIPEAPARIMAELSFMPARRGRQGIKKVSRIGKRLRAKPAEAAKCTRKLLRIRLWFTNLAPRRPFGESQGMLGGDKFRIRKRMFSRKGAKPPRQNETDCRPLRSVSALRPILGRRNYRHCLDNKGHNRRRCGSLELRILAN